MSLLTSFLTCSLFVTPTTVAPTTCLPATHPNNRTYAKCKVKMRFCPCDVFFFLSTSIFTCSTFWFVRLFVGFLWLFGTIEVNDRTEALWFGGGSFHCWCVSHGETTAEVKRNSLSFSSLITRLPATLDCQSTCVLCWLANRSCAHMQDASLHLSL